VQQVAWNW